MIGNIIELRGIRNYLGGQWVHDGLNCTIQQKEIVAIIGPSGCGKTTLLNTILLLRMATEGELRLFGNNPYSCSLSKLMNIRSRWGVMFQSGALFSSMTILENIMYPINAFTRISSNMLSHLARVKLELVGLGQSVAEKYPSELSGGMIKRAAMARCIALDPELIFLDEPTAGLDPESASDLDQLVLQLRETLGLTVVMVTHDLDSLWTVPDRVVFLGEGKVLAALPMDELSQFDHPLVRKYFSVPRSRLRMQVREEG